MKNQGGITLVALVITIIILLILAGITIAALNNVNLFTNAKRAVNVYSNKAEEENTAEEEQSKEESKSSNPKTIDIIVVSAIVLMLGGLVLTKLYLVKKKIK